MENVLKKVMIIRSGEYDEKKMKLSGVGIRQIKFLLYYPLNKYVGGESKVILISSSDSCSKESAMILTEGLGIDNENTPLLLNHNNYDDSVKDSVVLDYIKEKVIEKNADIVIIIVPFIEYSNPLSRQICKDMGKTFSTSPLKSGEMVIIDLERKLAPEVY